MMDTYIKAKSWAVMKAFLTTEVDGQLMPNTNFQNIISPMKGRGAIAAVGVEGEENYVPEQPARGDPEYWYTCIRSEEAVTLPLGLDAAAPEEAIPLIGVWA
jgi:hypothetical protein